MSFKPFILFLILGCLYAFQGNAQSKEAKSLYEEGVRAIDLGNYDKARHYFGKAMDVDPRFADPIFYLGFLEYYAENYKEAVFYLNGAMEVATEPSVKGYFLLGMSYMKMAEYEKAKENFEKLLAFEDIDPKIKNKTERALVNVTFAIKAVKNPVPFNPVNLGSNINTQEDEYLPTLTTDEKTLIITRRKIVGTDRAGNPSKFEEDFYISTKENGSWGVARNLGPPVNTKNNEGAQSLSPDGQLLFYTGCNLPGGHGSCDIYQSERIGDGWSKPKNLGLPISTSGWDTQPSLAPDGKTLYFTSKRAGGKGGADIWRSVLQDNGKWSKPVSLAINTKFDEISPFIHPDGKTLYFASKGHPGMGELDIFYSRRSPNGEFEEAINIGYPINTPGNESSLIVSANGNTAYFAADREGTFGHMDIYSFELHDAAKPGKVTFTSGKVYDMETNKPLKAAFELIDLETGEIVVQASSDSITGNFIVSLPTGKEYALNVSKKKYLFYSEHFSIEEKQLETQNLDVPLQSVKAGSKVVMRNIFFRTGKYTLSKQSEIELNRLVDFLKENEEIKIEVSGHTDNTGSETVNQALSENRAKSVYNYLVKNGIPTDRLSFKGYGSSQPIETNDTEKGRAQNRRTEFLVLE